MKFIIDRIPPDSTNIAAALETGMPMFGAGGLVGGSSTVPAPAATWRDGFLASSGSDCAVVHP